jgi:uncharacterized membrane protein (DUF2068 family)
LNQDKEPLPVPDKKIPASIAIIGTFEIGIALIGFILVFLVGQSDLNTFVFVVLLIVYGAMGAGLWAIQEWARFANVVLHAVAIPYTIYTSVYLNGPAGLPPILISIAIIYALTRPDIRHKFQTVVPKKR